MKRIFINGTIITLVEGQEVIEQGAMGVDGTDITYIGPVPGEDELASYDEVIDCRGRAIMPGLVNTHGHAAMTLLRGYADDLPLQTWLEEKMWPLEARFTAKQVSAGTALAVAEMIKSGTTCFVDMYDHMDEVAKITMESGMPPCWRRMPLTPVRRITSVNLWKKQPNSHCHCIPICRKPRKKWNKM